MLQSLAWGEDVGLAKAPTHHSCEGQRRQEGPGQGCLPGSFAIRCGFEAQWHSDLGNLFVEPLHLQVSQRQTHSGRSTTVEPYRAGY